MKCVDVCNLLEANIGLDKACSWDNVGLLVGDRSGEINKIYVAVDATDRAIDKAKEVGADMILCHHPLIFSPLKRITSDDFISNRVVNLIRNNVNLYAMHTNYDVVRMADVVANRMRLTNMKVLEYTSLEEGLGLGKIGNLPHPMTLKELAKFIKEKFQLPGVTVFESTSLEQDELIEEIAVLPGSGKSAIETVIKSGIKVYITGDIGHHEGTDSASRGISIIDAGHYGLEHVFVGDMVEVLKDLLPEMEIIGEEVTHPFYCV